MSRFGLDGTSFLGITTDNASSNYSMTSCLSKLLESGGTEWSAVRNHLACMTHVIQLALSAFMTSLGVKARNKSWEEAEREKIGRQQVGSHRRRGGVARVEKVALLDAGFNKIIEKVRLRAGA